MYKEGPSEDKKNLKNLKKFQFHMKNKNYFHLLQIIGLR